jgi:hypothetical protein
MWPVYAPTFLRVHKSEFLQLCHDKLRVDGVQYSFEQLRKDYIISLQDIVVVFIVGVARAGLNVRMHEVILHTLPD